jgi:putative SOS response-associated peptidase YedK
MCGRARLSSDVSEIKLVFSIPPEQPTPNIAPSWNVAPTDPLPVVRYDADFPTPTRWDKGQWKTKQFETASGRRSLGTTLSCS